MNTGLVKPTSNSFHGVTLCANVLVIECVDAIGAAVPVLWVHIEGGWAAGGKSLRGVAEREYWPYTHLACRQHSQYW